MRTLISINDCYALTGFQYEDLLSLTGIFTIHGKLEFLSLASQPSFKYSIFFDDEDDLLTVEMTDSPKIEVLRIKIKSRDNLYVDYFRLQQTYKGGNLGFKRLIKQIEEARRLNFKEITLQAYGDYSLFPIWDGYIVWGKYGFRMYRRNDITYFTTLMQSERLSHCTEINVLVSSKEGAALWKHIGRTWDGKFELANGSNSDKIYIKYGSDRSLF